MREKQDGERKIRENAILVKDLVAERDQYKRIVSEKEEEIMELGSQVSRWRSANTDLKLIEEKVDQFLTELRHVIDQNRHNAKPWL